MALSEETGSFPTIDEVLNELKRNGTFDQFRKSCLASVQAEPSFRAYGEHIEVVSRRYLQNFKWRESTTKNQVRTRLKDHALRVIESPDIQVGVPFSELVEKAMEAQGKGLLPKIVEVVNSLRQSNRLPTQGYGSEAVVKQEAGEENNVQKTGLEFDLTLPIDLPGLKPSGVKKDLVKKDSNTGKKEPVPADGSSKTIKTKMKPTDWSLKGSSAPKLKGDSKPHVEGVKDANRKDKDGGQKLPPLAEGKKDSKLRFLKHKKVKEESSDVSSISRGKQKELTPPETSERQGDRKDSSEANKTDKLASGSSQKVEQKKERSEIIKKDKVNDETVENLGEKDFCETERDEVVVDGLGNAEKCVPVAGEIEMSPNEINAYQNRKNSNLKDVNESEFCFVSLEGDHTRKDDDRRLKPLPHRRRSARLASLSDDPMKDEPHQDDEDLGEAAERDSLDDKWYKTKMAETYSKSSKKVGGLSYRSQRKAKAHLDSSSDEYEEHRSYSVEKILVDTDVGRPSSSKRFGHRKRSLKLDHDPTREGIYTKRARTMSRTGSPASTGSSASSSVHQDGHASGRHHKPAKGKKQYLHQPSSSFRHASKSRSPTPVVVTRSNRHVKPNRRYYGSDEEEPMDLEEESSEEEQPKNTRKHNTLKHDKRS